MFVDSAFHFQEAIPAEGFDHAEHCQWRLLDLRFSGMVVTRKGPISKDVPIHAN